MANNVEKITVQQSSGDVAKGKMVDAVDNTKIEVFPLGTGLVYSQKPVQEKTQNFLFSNSNIKSNFPIGENVTSSLFGSEIIVEEPPKKEVAKVTTTEKSPALFSVLSNYYKSIRYGVTQLDAAADPNVKKALGYIPDKDSLYAAIDSNKRIAAILSEAGILPA